MVAKNKRQVAYYYSNIPFSDNRRQLIKEMLRRYELSVFSLMYKRLYSFLCLLFAFISLTVAILFVTQIISIFNEQLKSLTIYSVLPILGALLLLFIVFLVLYMAYKAINRPYRISQFSEDIFLDDFDRLITNPQHLEGTFISIYSRGIKRNISYQLQINGETVKATYATIGSGVNWSNAKSGQTIAVHYVNQKIHMPVLENIF